MAVQNRLKNTAYDWDRTNIVYALRKRGWTLRSLAKECGVTYGTLSSAFHKSYPKMENIIASAIDLEPEQIWPQRYARRNFVPSLKQKRA